MFQSAWRLVHSDEAIDEVTTRSSSSSSDEEVGAGDHGHGSEDTTSGSLEGETGAGDRASGSVKGKSSKKTPGKGTGKIIITSEDTDSEINTKEEWRCGSEITKSSCL